MKQDLGVLSRLSRLLDEALDLPEAERLPWLDGMTDLPDELREHLRSLLATDEATDFQLPPLPAYADAELAALGADAASPQANADAPDTRIGPYRLIREIGWGGMGAVWLAEREDGSFKRQVALKLPHSSLPQRQLAERFARERNILASLEHPHIARLYDAGVTPEGRPWLAMEFVCGKSIVEHCHDRRLDLPGRLRLFLQVARALQYAHSRLVIHRDLKPNNILVTDEGDTRLLDFGIAKLLQANEATTAAVTEFESRALTPQYAAPEQILGMSIGTGADLYSLGLILYELLTGTMPYRVKRDTRGALEEAILESEVQPASQSALGRQPWAKALRGDLDTILTKALKKSPEERYATAAAFAEDVERYLSGKPVLAQPDSFAYRARKFVRRYRWGVAATALIVISLTGGLGAALWQARVAEEHAELARKEARTAQAVETFVTGIFLANSAQQKDPLQARETTARQLLDIGAGRIDLALQDAPEARVRMLSILANLYSDVGLDDTAAEFAEKRIAAARTVYGQDSEELAEALLAAYAVTHDPPGGPSRLGSLLQEAEAVLEKLGDQHSRRYGQLQMWSAWHWTNRDFARARAHVARAVAILRNSPDAPGALKSAADIAHKAGDYPSAQSLAVEGIAAATGKAVATRGELAGHDDLPGLWLMAGEAAWALNHLTEAEQAFQAAVDAGRHVFGDADTITLYMKARLAEMYALTNRGPDAAALLADIAESIRHRRAGEAGGALRGVRLAFARAQIAAAQWSEASESVAWSHSLMDYDASPLSAAYLRDRARIEAGLGRHAEARVILERAVATREKAGIRPADVLNREAMIRAQLLMAERKAAEAAALLSGHASEPYPERGPSPDGNELALLRIKALTAAGHPATALALARTQLAAIEASPQRTYLSSAEAALRRIVEGH